MTRMPSVGAQHVRRGLAHHLDRLEPVGALGDDLDAAQFLEGLPQRQARRLFVVDDDHAQRRVPLAHRPASSRPSRPPSTPGSMGRVTDTR
jgi:hypothetical protein